MDKGSMDHCLSTTGRIVVDLVVEESPAWALEAHLSHPALLQPGSDHQPSPLLMDTFCAVSRTSAELGSNSLPSTILEAQYLEVLLPIVHTRIAWTPVGSVQSNS